MNKGFTLIELLVILGIIFILGAMIVSAITNDEPKETETDTDLSDCELQGKLGVTFIPQECYPFFKEYFSK